MATSKVRAKGKLKKSIGRLGKMKLGNKDPCEGDTPDLSQLRKPIDISLSSLRQIAQLFEKGSDEVRDILTYECDVVYECRICRSLFRSLANFISHKRVYCLEKYSVKPRRYSTDSPDNLLNVYHNKNKNNNNNNSEKRTLVDFNYKENYSNDRILRSQATRKEPKKDLTSVVDMLIKKQNSDFHRNDVYSSKTLRISNDNEQVLLEMMDSNQAAYQTISPSSSDDLMKTQTEELRNMSNRKTAVLGPDGQFHDMHFDVGRNGGQSENDDFDFDIDAPNSTSGEDLTCTTCNAKFATKKTLTFHVKCQHTPHRLGFPCPCCSSVFTNRWSVYRHLFKVHRKSNVQVRRLRSQIHARSIRSDFSRLEKTSKSSESTHQETVNEEQNLTTAQEWMKNLELDAEQHRCSACGKRFDRKAALASHSLICKERATRGDFTRRHKRASKNPPQRVESLSSDSSTPDDKTSRIRREAIVTSKPPSNTSALTAKSVEPPSPRLSCPIIPKSPKDPPEIAIRVEGVSSLSKDVWDMIGNDDFASDSRSETLEAPKTVTIEDQPIRPATESVSTGCVNKTPEKTSSDVPEVIYTSIDNSRPVTLSVLETEKKLGIQYRGIRLPTVTLEKININAVSRQPPTSPRVTAVADFMDKPFANLRKLQCLPCNRKFLSLLSLKRHTAVHRRRSRYSCKLCDFQAFLKCHFVAHCNKMHNARNNRNTLSDLMIEMPLVDERPTANEDARLLKDFEVVDVARKKVGRPPKIKRENQQAKPSAPIEATPPAPIAVDPAVPAKPRRGRPPKSEGRRGKKKKIAKRNLRRPRPVSPPALNDDFSGSEEMLKISDSTPAPPGEKQNSPETPASRLRAPSRMDCDPALRKMVMEVIFGPAEKPKGDEEANKTGEIPTDDVTIEKLETEAPDRQQPDCQVLSSEVECVEPESNVALRKSEIQAAKREQNAMDHRPIVLLAEQANNNVQREKKKPVIISDDVSIVDESTRKNPIVLGRRLVRLQTSDVAHRKNSLLLPKPPRETVRLIILDHGSGTNATTAVRQANILVPAER